MGIAFENSVTKENLMRAFAGESQARNRYVISARKAEEQGLHVIQAVFLFTADQEETHASIFYNFLRDMAEKNISIDGTYPVDISDDVAKLLRMAEHNEMEEHDDVYKHFAQTAKEEGFPEIASAFDMIADIEKVHGERFGNFAKLLEENKLFISDVETSWICLNCGHVFRGEQAPPVCPVCHSNRGYFVRISMCPYTE